MSKAYLRFIPLWLSGMVISACSITVDIQDPADGSSASDAFDLVAEIRSSGHCMGGDRCGHTDWVLQIDGTEVFQGTGQTGNGDFDWCDNRMSDYCIFHWDNVRGSDLGSGSHLLTLIASAQCHRNASDQVTITVP
jgi:hypothetical protein